MRINSSIIYDDTIEEKKDSIKFKKKQKTQLHNHIDKHNSSIEFIGCAYKININKNKLFFTLSINSNVYDISFLDFEANIKKNDFLIIINQLSLIDKNTPSDKVWNILNKTIDCQKIEKWISDLKKINFPGKIRVTNITSLSSFEKKSKSALVKLATHHFNKILFKYATQKKISDGIWIPELKEVVVIPYAMGAIVTQINADGSPLLLVKKLNELKQLIEKIPIIEPTQIEASFHRCFYIQSEKNIEEQLLKIKIQLNKWHRLNQINAFLSKYKEKEYIDWFPSARKLHRNFIIHTGPTNSGKTYHAIQALMNAKKGLYLGPLRLNAQEVWTSMIELKIPCDLITGEEKKYSIEPSFIQCSTYEMFNSREVYDIAVIDEGQFISDLDRGQNIVEAIVGLQAETIHITCAPHSLESLVKLIKLCGDDHKVNNTKRLCPLKPLKTFIGIDDIKPKTALIAFSRNALYNFKKELESRGHCVSIIYGSLAPELRREQAKRFNDGVSDIIVATDAIGIGLNLDIETIIIAEDEKFDGEDLVPIPTALLKQIIGRAGRYGKHNKGYYGGLNKKVHEFVRKEASSEIEDFIPARFAVKPNKSMFEDLINSGLFDSSYDAICALHDNLSAQHNFEFIFPLSILETASLIEYETLIQDFWLLSHAPVDFRVPSSIELFSEIVSCVNKKEELIYKSQINENAVTPKTEQEIRFYEDLCKLSDLLMWASFHYPQFIKPAEIALMDKQIAIKMINIGLNN